VAIKNLKKYESMENYIENMRNNKIFKERIPDDYCRYVNEVYELFMY